MRIGRRDWGYHLEDEVNSYSVSRLMTVKRRNENLTSAAWVPVCVPEEVDDSLGQFKYLAEPQRPVATYQVPP